MESGGDYEYPFEFEASSGPVSQRGNWINIDWFLEARADVDLGPGYRSTEFDPREIHGGTLLFVIGSILSVVSVYLFLPTVYFFMEFREVLLTARLLVSAVLLLIGGLLLFFGLRNRFAAGKLGDLKVSFEPNVIRAGESLSCKVSFIPPGEISASTT